MTTLEMDPVFTAALREMLVATVEVSLVTVTVALLPVAVGASRLSVTPLSASRSV